jgi:hypothetical protein
MTLIFGIVNNIAFDLLQPILSALAIFTKSNSIWQSFGRIEKDQQLPKV